MAVTSSTYSGNGSNRDFAIGFAYTSRSFVKAYVGGVITGAWTFLNDTTVRFTVAPPSGTNNVEIRRVTSTTPLVDFVGAATITDTDLDLSILQMLHVLEENQNNSLVGMQQSGGNWNATNDRITNVATPLASTDAATKGYSDSVVGSAADAEASADAAADSAADALAQAIAASGYANDAQAEAILAASSAASISSVLPISGLTANEVPVATGATSYDAIPVRLGKLISSPSGSAVAQVDIALTGGYDEYVLELFDFFPATDAAHLAAQFSLDNGSTYVSTNDYKYVLNQTSVGGNRNSTDAAAPSIRLAGSLDNTRVSRGLFVRIFMGDGSAKWNGIYADGFVQDSTAGNAVGVVNIAGDLESAYTRATHIRLSASTGNITLSGKLYGIVR